MKLHYTTPGNITFFFFNNSSQQPPKELPGTVWDIGQMEDHLFSFGSKVCKNMEILRSSYGKKKYMCVFNDLVIKNCIKVLILGGMLESWT